MKLCTRCSRLFTGALLLSACAGSGRATPSEALPDEGWVASQDGTELFYRIVGEGTDTVVVLHGGPGFTMHSVMDDFAPLAESHALLFFDQRGAGGSTLVSDSTSLALPRVR